jgi:hypothetical protein
VSESNLGRMLLSHNFQLSPEVLSVLSREDFTAIFTAGLAAPLQCQIIENPHWIVEILFPLDAYTPSQIGELCGRVLAAQRQPNQGKSDILVLGGVKTTPPTSNSPLALQPGDWGVDVVETPNGEEFLRSINWDVMVADKPANAVFRVALTVEKT